MLLYLLTGTFSPLIFKVIFDKYVFIVILNLVQLILFLICFFFCFSFCSLIILFYACVLFYFCESIIIFCFGVTLFLKYANPFLLLLTLIDGHIGSKSL